jgi:hypothetical protein
MGKQASAVVNARRESRWRDRIARCSASKQSIEAFCRSEAVSTAAFYGWRARLRSLDVDAALSQRAAPSPFIDLGSVNVLAASTAVPGSDVAPNHTRTGIEVRIDLGYGVVLTIVRH